MGRTPKWGRGIGGGREGGERNCGVGEEDAAIGEDRNLHTVGGGRHGGGVAESMKGGGACSSSGGIGYHKSGYPSQEGKKRQKRNFDQQRRAPSRSAIDASPEPGPRAQSTPHPSPGLECNQRLARAPTSSAINASPEPRPRAQSTPRPSPGLERNQRLARASASTPGFSHTAAVPLTRREPCLPCRGRARRPLFHQLPSL